MSEIKYPNTPTSDTINNENNNPSLSTNTTLKSNSRKPTSIIMIGMAGSGKTTLMQRLHSHLLKNESKSYGINLDPAVMNLNYPVNIDIRDTVNYKEVMSQYNLGPNGGILTALNLFTTKFDQVLDIIAKKEANIDHILIDTPGQIEIFTWSASGAIITEALSVTYPTVIAYIIDTPRTTSPATFMSNMLYACSILYKTKLPFILVFNKTDVTSHDFAMDWLNDFESFQMALQQDTSFMASFCNSMCLVLEEFYANLRSVGCSAVTGQGIDEFFKKVEEAREEYEREFLPELEKIVAEKEKALQEKKEADLQRLMKDLTIEEEGIPIPDFGKKKPEV